MDIQQAKEFGAMQEDIKNVKNDVSEIKRDLKDFILSAETKYASKWAERVWIFVFSAIGVGILSYLGYAIIHVIRASAKM